MWDILKVFRLFKYMSKEVEAFVKITKLLKDNFREVEAFLNWFGDFIMLTRLFNNISRGNGGFCLEMWGFYKDFNYFWRLFLEKLRFFQGLQGFLNTFLVELRLF
jgi:hypothetical protein